MNSAHRFFLVLALAGAASTGCRNDAEWSAQPTQAGGISIMARSVEATSVRIQFRGSISNRGAVPILFTPGLVSFTARTGQTVPGVGAHHRDRGMEIMPGAIANVSVDFDSTGFNFRRSGGGQINWTGSMTVGGQPFEIPPTAVGN